ncbi:hypothetical protein DICA4_F02234 [Diutina catenulata]
MSPTVFRARKRDASAMSDTSMDSSAHSGPKRRVGATELTKTPSYCVSRLPAMPAQGAAVFNGYTDCHTNYGIVITRTAIQAWPYTSIDPSPLMFDFPIDNAADLPLALLTRPAPGNQRDPGVVHINATTGEVRFFESVRHLGALKLIDNPHWEVQVPLDTGEVITLAQNVEPAGIALATSKGRALVVSLRDVAGKPSLQVVPLQNRRSFGGRLLARVFAEPAAGAREVCAIKGGRVASSGMAHDVLVLDAAGVVSVYRCQLLSSSGDYCVVERSFSHSAVAAVESCVESHLPGASIDIEFLDICWSHDDVYLLLCRTASLVGPPHLLVLTTTIDATGVLVTATKKLTSTAASDAKLYLPAPGKTCFVVAGSTVVLADVDGPAWEDSVTFGPEVTVVGYGQEDVSATKNPGLVAVTQNDGVIRIERFPTSECYDPVKSHIEQGVFFAATSELDFALPTSASPQRVREAATEVAREIVASTSPYWHPLPTVSDSLQRRLALLRQLLAYCDANHVDRVDAVYEAMEQVAVAAELWQAVEGHPQFRAVFDRVLPQAAPGWFDDVSGVLSVLVKFVDGLRDANVALDEVVAVVVATQHPVVESEQQSDGPRPLWVLDSPLLFRMDDLYQTYYNKPELVAQDRVTMVRFCETLYFYINRALALMEADGDANLAKYRQWYHDRRHRWLEPLVAHEEAPAALAVAEAHHDHDGIVYVLSGENAPANPYARYLSQYGYPFAQALFRFFLAKDEPARLLGFPEAKPFLLQFLKESPEAEASVGWIVHLIDGDYGSAAAALAPSHPASLAAAQFKVSVAKLASVAVGAVPPALETRQVVIGAQKRLYDSLVNTHKQAAANKHGLHVDDRVLNRDAVVEMLTLPYNQLVGNRVVEDTPSVVDMLTLFTSATVDGAQGYADAVVVASTVSLELTEVAWTRILVLGDDWSGLAGLESLGDAAVRHKIRSSTLYKTLRKVPPSSTGALRSVVQGVSDEVAAASHVDVAGLQTEEMAHWVGKIIEDALAKEG